MDGTLTPSPSPPESGGLPVPAYFFEEAVYERHGFPGRVEPRDHYRMELDPSFPLDVRLFDFPRDLPPIRLTWHERLELFFPVAGYGTFSMGADRMPFEAGDALLVDNLKLHAIDAYRGNVRRGVIVVFYPSLVAPPGALPCDAWLLRPFLHRKQRGGLRLMAQTEAAKTAWRALERLAKSERFDRECPGRPSRSKTALLELLLVLEEAWRARLNEERIFETQQAKLRRLAPVFDLLNPSMEEKPSVAEAARLAGMSPSYFMRFFQRTTGVPFARYVDNLRVNRAYEMLIGTDLPIADIAAELGFCDQAHLSNRVRRQFGSSPREIRAADRRRQSQE
jgi:AraC-like DNA-binding protein